MRNWKSILTGLFSAALLLQAATGYKVIGHYTVGGTGGFDYVTIDGAARKIYISHATQVDVVDADSGKAVGVIPDTPGVHGIAIASEFKHGFTSNGRENKVSMFDPSDLHLIKKIDVGKGPDGIYYDPKTKRVFTNNHGSHDVTALDAATGEVVGTVKVEGDGEQAVIGKDGMIYLNSENTAEVVVFDPKSLEVKHRFPIGVARVPTAGVRRENQPVVYRLPHRTEDGSDGRSERKNHREFSDRLGRRLCRFRSGCQADFLFLRGRDLEHLSREIGR